MKKIIKWLMLVGITVSIVMGVFTTAVPSVDAQAETVKTDRYLSAIKQRGYLVVGLSADYPPYEFHKTIDGKDKIVGFDIDVAQKIANDLGVKLRINEMGFDGLLGALKTGKVDMIISGMSTTPERAKQVSFSTPYLIAKQKVLIRKADVKKYRTTMDFDDVKVGAQKQTTQETLAQTQLVGSSVVSLQKFTDLILQLENHKIDAIVAEEPVAKAYVQQNKQLKMVDVGFTNADKPTAVAMPKDSPALTAAVNQSIKQIKQQKLLPKYQKKANSLMFSKESFLKEYGSYFLSGTGFTIALAIIGVLFGAIVGTLFALMRRSKRFIIKAIAVAYIEYTRGTPLLVQVFIVFFGTQMIGLNVSAFISSSLAMGLNSAAYVAEIIRSGINSVASGQEEASRSLGLSDKQSMRFVILPQAIKNILPALGNEFIAVIKESSIVSVVGVGELMFQAGVVQGASFRPFVPLIIASVIYFILTFSLSRSLGVLEHHFDLAKTEKID